MQAQVTQHHLRIVASSSVLSHTVSGAYIVCCYLIHLTRDKAWYLRSTFGVISHTKRPACEMLMYLGTYTQITVGLMEYPEFREISRIRIPGRRMLLGKHGR